MKRLTALLLISVLILGGCGRKIDNSGYQATGDAILMEGQDPEDIMPEEEDTQELTLAYYPDRSLNPLFGSDYTNRVLMSLMYQGLFAVDSKKNVTPILCGKYEVSDNRRNWTIYLDPNATFSDGTKVTAQDVVACYLQAKENDYYKNRFVKHLLDVSVLENGGILFQMDTAYENLPLLLDVPIIKASEVNQTEGTPPVGSGPYVFVKTAGGAQLHRNPTWWCGNVKIPATDESIDLVEVSSPADVRDEFQFGNVSVVCTNPMSDSFAEYRCDYELWEIESGYLMYIGCNITYSDFFEDSNMRINLTYGIDRQTLAQDVYKGLVEPVTLPCAPTESYYSKTLADKYAYDPAKFVSFLTGYTIPKDEDGAQKELRILVNSDDSARVRAARNIAQNLTELGLPATTLEKTTGAYQDVLVAQTYDIYLGMTRLSPNMDLTEFFRGWGELSWGGLAHETLQGMCSSTLDNSGTYYNLYQKLAEDGRIIPVLFGYYNVYARRGLLPDLNPSRDNVFYYSLGKTMEGTLTESLPEETEAAEETA